MSVTCTIPEERAFNFPPVLLDLPKTEGVDKFDAVALRNLSALDEVGLAQQVPLPAKQDLLQNLSAALPRLSPEGGARRVTTAEAGAELGEIKAQFSDFAQRSGLIGTSQKSRLDYVEHNMADHVGSLLAALQDLILSSFGGVLKAFEQMHDGARVQIRDQIETVVKKRAQEWKAAIELRDKTRKANVPNVVMDWGGGIGMLGVGGSLVAGAVLSNPILLGVAVSFCIVSAVCAITGGSYRLGAVLSSDPEKQAELNRTAFFWELGATLAGTVVLLPLSAVSAIPLYASATEFTVAIVFGTLKGILDWQLATGKKIAGDLSAEVGYLERYLQNFNQSMIQDTLRAMRQQAEAIAEIFTSSNAAILAYGRLGQHSAAALVSR